MCVGNGEMKQIYIWSGGDGVSIGDGYSRVLYRGRGALRFPLQQSSPPQNF